MMSDQVRRYGEEDDDESMYDMIRIMIRIQEIHTHIKAPVSLWPKTLYYSSISTPHPNTSIYTCWIWAGNKWAVNEFTAVN